MSEAAIQTAMQATLREILSFANASVVINDWKIMDGSTFNAPYVLIDTADSMTSRQDTLTPVTDWQIPVTLFVRFVDWQQAHGDVRDLRQAIVDKFNEVGSNRSPGGGSVTANVIRTNSPITPWYDPYANSDAQPDPVFVTQELILEVQEF